MLLCPYCVLQTTYCFWLSSSMFTTLGLISLPQKQKKSQEQGRNLLMLFCCVVTGQIMHNLFPFSLEWKLVLASSDLVA